MPQHVYQNLCGLVVALLLACAPGLAQTTTLTGRVSDRATGQSLPGAYVVVPNTTAGTTTDAAGRFQLTVPVGTPAVEASLIGYKRQLVPVGTDSLRIDLAEDVFNLDAVVVTGQGIDVTKRRLSSNIAIVTAAQMALIPVPRLEQLLQSQLPTTQVSFSGGQPGSTSFIRTRGIQSAFLNSTPVIYVDGIRVDNLNTFARLSLNLSGNLGQGATTSALSDLPVENIDRIEYVNGGAATTLYGSDAANGVIQIFTKRGGNGRTNVAFEAQGGVERATTDYYNFARTADLLHQSGAYQLYRLSANGGNDKVGFSVSGSMTNSTGTLIYNQNADRRYDIRTTVSAKISDKVQYTGSFGFANQRFKRVRNGNAGGYVGLWFAEGGASNNFFPGRSHLDALPDNQYQEIKAFVQRAEELQNNTIRLRRFQTGHALEIKPFKNFTVRATVGVDYRNSLEQGVVTSTFLIHTRQANTLGSISNFERNLLGLTTELVGQYNLKAKDFSFLTTVGGQLFRFEDRQVAFIGQNVRDGALTIGLAGIRTADEAQLTTVNYGVYAQENVGFKDRYFLEFGLRGDNNPAFGGNIGVQYYPKIGASYIVSDEPWLARAFGGNGLSFLKLRGNYGVAGNLPPAFTNLPTVAINPFLGNQAATFGLPGNASQRPERIYTAEAGLELGLLRNRLAFNVTYYRALTRDALFDYNPAPSSGENAQRLNIGEIENRGWELAANVAVVKTKTWTANFRLALNTTQNTVLRANAPLFSISGFSAGTAQSVVQEGSPVGFLRGRRVTFGPDGNVAEQTQQVNLGTTIPTMFGNVVLNVSYKNRLTLFATADYQQGAFAHSFDKGFRIFYGVTSSPIPDAAYNTLVSTRTLSSILNNYTNLFVESTDYLKIRLISVNYVLPPPWYRGVLQSAELGFTATNPFNFVRSSFDPEATIAGGRDQGGATTGGFNYSVFSRPRQFIITLRLRL